MSGCDPISSASPPPPPTRTLRGAFAETAAAVLGYVLLSAFYLRPIWSVLRTHITPSADPLLLLVVLKWGARAWDRGLADFWNAPYFHPTPGATALSEHLLGPSLAFKAAAALTGSHIAAFNLLLWSSFVLCGAVLFTLLRHAGVSPWAAFLAGCVFSFSPFRWDHQFHLQLLLAAFLPWTMWAWHRLLAKPSPARAAGFLVPYALHLSGATYLAYIVHLPLAAITVLHARAVIAPDPGRRHRLSVLTATVGVSILLLTAIYGPYIEAGQALGLRRQSATFLEFGASVASFLTPSATSIYGGPWMHHLARPENALFAGFLPTTLLAIALCGAWRRAYHPASGSISSRQRAALTAAIGIASLGLLAGELSVWATTPSWRTLVDTAWPGPGWKMGSLLLAGGAGCWIALRRRIDGKWPFALSAVSTSLWERGLFLSGVLSALACMPVVFTPLSRILPGLDAMRVPARFYVVVSFAIAWTTARMLDRFWPRGNPSRRWAMTAATLFLLVELAPRPLSWSPLPDEAQFPQVHAWISRHPEVRSLIVLPFGRDIEDETQAMYFATRHWRPIVNGYSGYMPKSYEELRARCCFPVPDSQSLDLLRDWGVTHILVPQRYRKAGTATRRRALSDFLQSGEVAAIYSDERNSLYAIRPAPRGSRHGTGIATGR